MSSIPASFLDEAEINPEVGSYDHIPADSPRAIASSCKKLQVAGKDPRHVDDLKHIKLRFYRSVAVLHPRENMKDGALTSRARTSLFSTDLK